MRSALRRSPGGATREVNKRVNEAKNEDKNSSEGADSKIKKEEKNSPDKKKKKKIKDSPGPGIAVPSPRRSERETDKPAHYGKGWTGGFKTWKRF